MKELLNQRQVFVFESLRSWPMGQGPLRETLLWLKPLHSCRLCAGFGPWLAAKCISLASKCRAEMRAFAITRVSGVRLRSSVSSLGRTRPWRKNSISNN